MVCLTVDESVVARAPARSHFGTRLQLATRVRMMHAVIVACRLNIAGCDIVIQIHAGGGVERQAEVMAAVKATVPDLAVRGRIADGHSRCGRVQRVGVGAAAGDAGRDQSRCFTGMACRHRAQRRATAAAAIFAGWQPRFSLGRCTRAVPVLSCRG